MDNAQLNKLPKSRLIAKDLMPTTDKDRHISPIEFMYIWIGMSVLLTTFAVGANLYPSLSVMSILLSVILGNTVVCIVLALTGDIGLTHGIPFAVYLRVCYGYSGTHIPSFIRTLPAMFWLGFQTFLGAQAINIILTRTIGFPDTTVSVLSILIIYMAVQIITTAKGTRTIAVFEKLVSPLMVIIGIMILYWIMNSFNLNIRDIITVPAGPVEGIRYNFAYAITAMTGYWATMSLNIPDFTKHLKNDRRLEKNWLKRNWSSIWPQFVGVVPTMAFFAFIGSAAMVATNEWNPVLVIATMDTPALITFAALIVAALAQWSTNIGANILPPANIFANIFAPRVTFSGGCVIAGILSILMRPWVFADVLIPVFAYISAMLGGIAGTMIVDYYVLRKRRINIEELYKENGQYKYWNNFNPAGFVAYIAAFVAAMIWVDYGFIVAGIVGGLVYYIAMKYWVLKKYPQPEIEV